MCCCKFRRHASGIQDQNSFIVDDNRGTRVRFEFDRDGNTTPGSLPDFHIFPSIQRAPLRFAIQLALISANLGLRLLHSAMAAFVLARPHIPLTCRAHRHCEELHSAYSARHCDANPRCNSLGSNRIARDAWRGGAVTLDVRVTVSTQRWHQT